MSGGEFTTAFAPWLLRHPAIWRLYALRIAFRDERALMTLLRGRPWEDCQ